MSLRPLLLTALTLGAVSGCFKDKAGADDSGELIGPEDTAGTGQAQDSDETGDSSVTPEPACPHEEPPTQFTGGLWRLRSIVPAGGEWSDSFVDYVMLSSQGEIDWDAGTSSSDSLFLPGHTVVSSHGESQFTYSDNGDSSSTGTRSILRRDGSTMTIEYSAEKVGCVTTTDELFVESGLISHGVTELVSPTRREFDIDSEDVNGGLMRSTGWLIEGWEMSYDFDYDNPTTDRFPDRDGSCNQHPDGTEDCAIVSYHDGDRTRSSTIEVAFGGDSTYSFEDSDPARETNPYQWGEGSRRYEGDGEEQWWFYAPHDGSLVSCEGSWDSDGVGAYSCDNGDAGTLPR